ncbi:MAG: HAD-IA family hydrolase [Firmicutes bacterium]|nr:HAD-IA family hydrolase [Bacillota bacterium]
MSNIKAVLFDFDGTIMDTNNIILKSWHHAFKEIAGKEVEEAALLATFGEPLELTIRNFFGGDDETVRKNISIYRSFHDDNFEREINLFPGVYDMLYNLKKANFKLALVTSRLGRTTYIGTEKFGIKEAFDIIVTADDCSKHKPDPEPINIALRRLGVSAENAVMIGDTRLDMGCARNAGVTAVLVGWSMALAGGENPDAEYDYILKKPDDILDFLNNI